MLTISFISYDVENAVENVENEKNTQTAKLGVDNLAMVWYSNKAVWQDKRMSRTEKEILKKDEKST